MSIVRLVAVDPSPRSGESDVLVYQVTQGSRAMELLCSLFDEHKIEWIVLENEIRAKRTPSSRQARGDT